MDGNRRFNFDSSRRMCVEQELSVKWYVRRISFVNDLRGNDMENSWSVIQSRICRKCIDGDGRGNCRLPRGEQCALQQFLPAIVEIVSSLDSGSYDDYLRALRSQVCEQCREQLPDGRCLKRASLECALDRYYGLVIQVIDEAHAGTFSRAS